MPVIQVYVPKHVRVVEKDLSGELRKLVSEGFEIDFEHTEVVFFPIDWSANTTSLHVSILYSVRLGFEPDEKARASLANKVVQFLATTDAIALNAHDVSVWILPQHDAVFRRLIRRNV